MKNLNNITWKKIESIEEYEYDGNVYNLHVKDNHNYFANGSMVSNCHLAKATAQTGMFEKMTKVKYRIGTTGTIDNAQISQLQLEGILGPVHRVITTKELMDSNRVVNLSIQCIILKYNKEIRDAVMKKNKYQDEMEFLISNQARNKFIVNLALKQTGNTLVLFQFVGKHGRVLQKMLQEKVGDTRKIFFVSGDVSVEEREYIRINTEKEGEGKLLFFGSNSIRITLYESVPLSNGTVKIGKDILVTDDICDNWIKSRL